MTTSRLYASKKFMGALLLMMGFVFTRQCAVFTYFLFLWKVLIIVCS